MSEETRRIRTARAEIERLLAIADRDLDQAGLPEIHLDTRYALAYNAALQLATVILRLDVSSQRLGLGLPLDRRLVHLTGVTRSSRHLSTID